MGINDESDVSASLIIGPTSTGMVRLYVEADSAEIPMDFDPDEALEIAEELRAAAELARARSGGTDKPAAKGARAKAGRAPSGGPAESSRGRDRRGGAATG